VVEAVKRAEDDDDIVVRLYEATGASVDTVVHFGFPVAEAAEADLMETPLASLDVADDDVTLSFSPFEIKTLRLTPQS
jgi:alpha-mannosidase